MASGRRHPDEERTEKFMQPGTFAQFQKAEAGKAGF
jgi:hypothetical protein